MFRFIRQLFLFFMVFILGLAPFYIVSGGVGLLLKFMGSDIIDEGWGTAVWIGISIAISYKVYSALEGTRIHDWLNSLADELT